jgi:hypothetical protein
MLTENFSLEVGPLEYSADIDAWFRHVGWPPLSPGAGARHIEGVPWQHAPLALRTWFDGPDRAAIFMEDLGRLHNCPDGMD